MFHLHELARRTDDRRLVTRVRALLPDSGRGDRIREMPHVPCHQIIYSVHYRDGHVRSICRGAGRKRTYSDTTNSNLLTACRHHSRVATWFPRITTSRDGHAVR